MFRFLHAADLHLDSPLRGLDAHDGAPVNILRSAMRGALINLVDLAIAERVDFLVIAGDVYDGDWKDHSTGLFFRKQMHRLQEQAIPVYLISGNHDAASVISRKLTLPDNVHSFSTRQAESKRVDGLPVAIHGRGFPHRAVPENLAREYPDATAGLFNLGLLHTSLTGREGHDTYAPCTVDDLVSRGYDYWALGHIHQPEIVLQDPWIVFSGNTQGRTVRETGPRGCRLVTVDDSRQVRSVEWHSLDVIRWQILRVDLGGLTDEHQAWERIGSSLRNSLADAEGRLMATRMELTGATELHHSIVRDWPRWRAEISARADELGSEAVWLEKVIPRTSPRSTPTAGREHDPLARQVLEAVQRFQPDPGSFPPEVTEMMGLLPAPIRSALEADWCGDGVERLKADVQSLLLEFLSAAPAGTAEDHRP